MRLHAQRHAFAGPPKVIIDTDFNTIGDDGQVAVMAAQLYARGVIDLLGFTIASGNGWRDQEASAASIGSSPPPYIYDTVALAYLVHPEFATDTTDLYVDINTSFGKEYGKSIVYSGGTYAYASIGWLQKSTVIFNLNNAAFYPFYVDLLTRPVPVQFDCTPHDFND